MLTLLQFQNKINKTKLSMSVHRRRVKSKIMNIETSVNAFDFFDRVLTVMVAAHARFFAEYGWKHMQLYYTGIKVYGK